MAEMNLKQITDKLNTEFSGKNRKLVFWYDDNGDFEAEIDGLELNGAKVYHLETDNQFQTKHFLERVDTINNYLIYAPFPRPSVRDNHLEDTIRYSKVFYADRASLLMVDLGIDKKYKAVIQKHIKFFAARDRRQRFYDLEIQNFNKESIEVALMSCLCKTHTASFEEVVRVILMEAENPFENNRFLDEFQKYDLLNIFWDFCRQKFAYTEQSPSLEKLVFTLFLTVTQRALKGQLPVALKPFISNKTGNIIAFMDSLMNNVLYIEKYNKFSDFVQKRLDMESVLKGYEPNDLMNCDTFAFVDQLLIDWLVERLLAEDTGAKLGDLTLPEICRERLKKHFSKEFTTSYKLLIHAYDLIINANYRCQNNFKALVDQYLKVDFEIDGHYRKFFYYFDQLGDTAGFEKLASLVENIYSNEYLDKIVRGWNETFDIEEVKTTLPLQRRFYKRIIEPNKDKLVVIISDALRYEVGHELFLKLQADERCTASFSGMLGLIPSITRLGMAALLPHHSLSVSDDYKVLVDGKNADDLKQRETILKSYVLSSRCVQFDDIRNMKKAELREVFTGQEVVYIYHNQIDARGDKANTENEVFTACQEAVEEIDGLIRRLSGSANTYHFMVTADHGFIYKRDKLQESDKLSNNAEKDAFVNRRFIIQSNPLVGDGIALHSLGEILGNDDCKMVSTPISANIFKMPGGGQNYVHGGSSPQEMIVPLIDIKMEKGRVETRPASIMLVSVIRKITTLNVFLDFMQAEAVGEGISQASYRIYFITADNEKISNELLFIADKKDNDAQQRMVRLHFSFKNQHYDKSGKYYLLAVDESNGFEIFRHEVSMDLAFANDFGF